MHDYFCCYGVEDRTERVMYSDGALYRQATGFIPGLKSKSAYIRCHSLQRNYRKQKLEIDKK